MGDSKYQGDYYHLGHRNGYETVPNQPPPVYRPYDGYSDDYNSHSQLGVYQSDVYQQNTASPSLTSRYQTAFPLQEVEATTSAHTPSSSFQYQSANSSVQSQRLQSNHDLYRQPDSYFHPDHAPTRNQADRWQQTTPARSAQSHQKFLPIAIPQMTKGRGMPFMRLNSPALQELGISETEFIEFIDTLNIVSAASPPFKVLDLAGGIIGMVPHHWAQLTSNLLKLTAMGGTAIVSKSRTDGFMLEANQQIFGPKGLRACLITTAALIPSIKFPPQKAITLPLTLDIPLESQPSFHNRLLQGLNGYVSHTEATRLPSKKEDISVIDQMSAKQVARDIDKIDKQMYKNAEKQMKKLQKGHQPSTPSLGDESSGDTVAKPPIRSRSLDRKMRKVEHDIEKVNKKASRKMKDTKHSSDRVEDKRQDALLSLESKRERLLEKEAKQKQKSPKKHEKDGKGADEKMTEKLLWIYIDIAFDESGLGNMN
jgi:hypothetical protein